MHVLVLGGYGLIGSAIVRRLLADGHAVTGLGRSVSAARQKFPEVLWIGVDLTTLSSAEAWRPHLVGITDVVNAAGALQDAPRISLEAIQDHSMRMLYAACQRNGIRRLVQISAAGAAPDARTAFMRTKASADAALMQSEIEWTILRPGLVVGPKAYGGTALVRALAAIPFVIPVSLADAVIRTVALSDVVDAVSDALDGSLPSRGAYDLMEAKPHRMGDVIAAFRRWLGLSPALLVPLPGWIARATSVVADMLGYLGWRWPLRSTAVRVVERGINGDPMPYALATGRMPMSLDATLSTLPSGPEDGWFARLFLLKPIILATLAVFWTVSGLIGMMHIDAASMLLTEAGLHIDTARLAVMLGSLGDIAAGLLICHRRTARTGLVAALALTALYLLGGTLVMPSLWGDPLGPLVKAVPTAILALVALAILDDRG